MASRASPSAAKVSFRTMISNFRRLQQMLLPITSRIVKDNKQVNSDQAEILEYHSRENYETRYSHFLYMVKLLKNNPSYAIKLVREIASGQSEDELKIIKRMCESSFGPEWPPLIRLQDRKKGGFQI